MKYIRIHKDAPVEALTVCGIRFDKQKGWMAFGDAHLDDATLAALQADQHLQVADSMDDAPAAGADMGTWADGADATGVKQAGDAGDKTIGGGGDGEPPAGDDSPAGGDAAASTTDGTAAADEPAAGSVLAAPAAPAAPAVPRAKKPR